MLGYCDHNDTEDLMKHTDMIVNSQQRDTQPNISIKQGNQPTAPLLSKWRHRRTATVGAQIQLPTTGSAHHLINNNKPLNSQRAGGPFSPIVSARELKAGCPTSRRELEPGYSSTRVGSTSRIHDYIRSQLPRSKEMVKSLLALSSSEVDQDKSTKHRTDPIDQYSSLKSLG